MGCGSGNAEAGTRIRGRVFRVVGWSWEGLDFVGGIGLIGGVGGVGMGDEGGNVRAGIVRRFVMGGNVERDALFWGVLCFGGWGERSDEVKFIGVENLTEFHYRGFARYIMV